MRGIRGPWPLNSPGTHLSRPTMMPFTGMEPCWKNPWLAVRIYMDARQSIDLYLKQTPRLELDRTGFYSTKEMVDAGDGCDVLWAGKSVAMGSFRGYQNGNPVTIDSVAVRGQRVVDNHTVQIYDKDWIFNGHPIQMTQTYSVSPDSRNIDVVVELEGYAPSDVFATGVQKIEHDNEGFILKNGIAGSWGNNIPDKAHPDWIETVGLGIKVNPDNIVSAKEDDLNYLFPSPSGQGRKNQVYDNSLGDKRERWLQDF